MKAKSSTAKVANHTGKEHSMAKEKYSYVPIMTGDRVCVPKAKERKYVLKYGCIHRSKLHKDPTQEHINMAAWILQGELEEQFIGYALTNGGLSPSMGIQAGRITDKAMSLALNHIRQNSTEKLMKAYDEHLGEDPSQKAGWANCDRHSHKNNIKKAVGLSRPPKAGLDV